MKDILGYMGLSEDDAKDVDTFKQKFDATFVRKDPQAIKDDKELWNKVTGNYNEANKVLFKRHAKENGIDLSGYDLDKMNVGQVIDEVIPTVLKKYSSEINTLKEQAGKGASEKVKEVADQFEKYKSEVEPKVQEYEKLKGDFDAFRASAQNEMINFKKGLKNNEAWGGFKWSTSANPFAKAGFRQAVESKYQLDLDENGELIPKDKTGNRIPDPNKAGSYKSWAQILEDEGREANKQGGGIFAEAPQPPKHPLDKKEFKLPISEQNDGPKKPVINTATRQTKAA